MPLICLETALPAKFSATIREALGFEPPRPPAYADLESKPQRCTVLPADAARVKSFIAAHAGARDLTPDPAAHALSDPRVGPQSCRGPAACVVHARRARRVPDFGRAACCWSSSSRRRSISTPTGFARRTMRDSRSSDCTGKSSRSDLLALTSAVLAIVRRDAELYLALPIVILASFPAIQIAHVLPDLPQANSAVSGAGEANPRIRACLHGCCHWRCARFTYAPIRRARTAGRGRVAGGLLIIAPVWFAPLLGPLDPWWREYDATLSDATAVSPGIRGRARRAGVHDGPGARFPR